jgi:hypothetical protein
MVAQPRRTCDALELRIHSGEVIQRMEEVHNSSESQTPLEDWSEAH